MRTDEEIKKEIGAISEKDCNVHVMASYQLDLILEVLLDVRRLLTEAKK